MKSIKSMKAYFTFTKNSLQRNLAYRANSVIFLLGDLMLLGVTYYLWKAIYSSSPESILNGFNYNEMIVYVLISFITGIVINADIMHMMYREVKDGSIAMNLIRPINYEKRMFFESLGNLIYNFLIVFILGFICLLIFTIKTKGSINIIEILFYFVSVFLGFCINFFYSYTFGLFSFKITNMWGLSQITQAIIQLVSGALIPIVFFPKWAQIIFNFLPFKSMIYTPSMIYLGKLSYSEIAISILVQIFWVAVLAICARALWKKMIKNLTILGG